jgi:hypothetical protein
LLRANRATPFAAQVGSAEVQEIGADAEQPKVPIAQPNK